MRLLVSLIAATLVAAASAAAQTDDIMQKAINTPSIAYSFYGPAANYTAKVIKDATVQGGQAYRVDVKIAGPEAFTVGASSAITKSIAKGDKIVVALWARAPKLAAGETMQLPFVGVIGPAPGYHPIATGNAGLTDEWKLHQIRGTAPADFAAGSASVTLHLAAAKGVIDLGPVFALDFGAAK